jgi:hypothetical protein
MIKIIWTNKIIEQMIAEQNDFEKIEQLFLKTYITEQKDYWANGLLNINEQTSLDSTIGYQKFRALWLSI